MTGSTALDLFIGAAITASVGLIAGGIVALVRFIHRTDEDRLHRLDRVMHRQGHVVRWARAVGRHVGIPFPLREDLEEWERENGRDDR